MLPTGPDRTLRLFVVHAEWLLAKDVFPRFGGGPDPVLVHRMGSRDIYRLNSVIRDQRLVVAVNRGNPMRRGKPLCARQGPAANRRNRPLAGLRDGSREYRRDAAGADDSPVESRRHLISGTPLPTYPIRGIRATAAPGNDCIKKNLTPGEPTSTYNPPDRTWKWARPKKRSGIMAAAISRHIPATRRNEAQEFPCLAAATRNTAETGGALFDRNCVKNNLRCQRWPSHHYSFGITSLFFKTPRVSAACPPQAPWQVGSPGHWPANRPVSPIFGEGEVSAWPPCNYSSSRPHNP
jgi:hypothetical protein